MAGRAIESVTEQVTEVLGVYLKDEVSRIREVYDEFPDPNEKIKVPSISLITLAPRFVNADPYTIDIPNPSANFKYDVMWGVGDWTIPIQLDLFAANKKERNQLFEDVFRAINLRVNPGGLDLTLEKYFDRVAHYHVVNYAMQDQEEASQTRERRARIDLMTDVVAIVEKKEFAMATVQINESGEVEIPLFTEGEL